MLRNMKAAAAIGVLAMSVSILFAQTSAPAPVAPPAFEVASVKPNNSGGTVAIRRPPGGQWVATNASLRLLITWAYDITDERLVGGPGWLDSARFDVMAKAPNENPTRDQVRLMVQSLLADRFNLRVHSEQRELPHYRLEMDTGGAKVRVLNNGAIASPDPFRMPGLGVLSGTHVTAAMLAKVLSGQLGRYVDDKTGFSSLFDFNLEWRPDEVAGDVSADEGARPSIFTAVREQLGFRLIPEKGPVPVIVIDHVDRNPTAN